MKHLLTLILIALFGGFGISLNVFEEEVVSFKGSKQHMERLLACWMTLREHDPFENNRNLPLLKQCLRRLSDEEAHNRIASFVGKHTAPPKRLH
jgi:hypothetical protein